MLINTNISSHIALPKYLKLLEDDIVECCLADEVKVAM